MRAALGYIHGIGQAPSVIGDDPFSGDISNAEYDPNSGRYIGGSWWLDVYCSTIGALTGDPPCQIPTSQQIQQQVELELSTTSMTPENQAAAIAAGTAAIKAACAQNPMQGAAQNAAAMHPQLSALISPEAVATLFGIQCNGTTNPFAGFGIWIILGFAAIMLLKK